MLNTKMMFSKTVFWLLFSALICFSIVERFLFSMQSDTSMQISVLENMMRGMVLGVDVLEVSTPMAICIFLPGIYIGKIFGITSEFGIYITCYLLFFVSIYLLYRIDRKCKLLDQQTRPYFYLGYVFLYTFYYQDIFAQREYFTVLMMIPYLGLEAAYLTPKKSEISFWEKACSGLLMGLGSSVKPHFLLIFICFTLYGLYRERTLKVLFSPEKIFFYISYVIYFLWCYYTYPEYFSFMREYLLKNYVGDYAYWLTMLRQPHTISYIYMFLVVCIIRYKLLRGLWPAFFTVCFAASIIFFLIYMIQRKGFAYHNYPAFSLLFLCFLLTCYDGARVLLEKNVKQTDIFCFKGGMVLLSLFCLTDGFTTLQVTPSKTEVEKAVSQFVQHPTMLSLSPSLSDGHPLVRNLKGRWVGTYPSIWGAIHIHPDEFPLILNENFDDLPLDKRELFMNRKKVSLEQLATVADDIKERKPDIVIMHQNEVWKSFVLAQPDIQNALKDYELVARPGVLEIWKRKEI